jgi:hypothetical protein
VRILFLHARSRASERKGGKLPTEILSKATLRNRERRDRRELLGELGERNRFFQRVEAIVLSSELLKAFEYPHYLRRAERKIT